MIYMKYSIYISLFLLFVISSGGGGGTSFIGQLKKDAKTRNVLIIKNASKITMQSIELAKKSSTYRQEKLPSGLDCIKLGFSDAVKNRDINLSLVSNKQWKNKDLICEIDDYSKFDKNISGEFNTIFILKK